MYVTDGQLTAQAGVKDGQLEDLQAPEWKVMTIPTGFHPYFALYGLVRLVILIALSGSTTVNSTHLQVSNVTGLVKWGMTATNAIAGDPCVNVPKRLAAVVIQRVEPVS